MTTTRRVAGAHADRSRWTPERFRPSKLALMVVASSAFLLLAVAVGPRNAIDRKEGVSFVLLYVAYLAFLVDKNFL